MWPTNWRLYQTTNSAKNYHFPGREWHSSTSAGKQGLTMTHLGSATTKLYWHFNSSSSPKTPKAKAICKQLNWKQDRAGEMWLHYKHKLKWLICKRLLKWWNQIWVTLVAYNIYHSCGHQTSAPKKKIWIANLYIDLGLGSGNTGKIKTGNEIRR